MINYTIVRYANWKINCSIFILKVWNMQERKLFFQTPKTRSLFYAHKLISNWRIKIIQNNNFEFVRFNLFCFCFIVFFSQKRDIKNIHIWIIILTCSWTSYKMIDFIHDKINLLLHPLLLVTKCQRFHQRPTPKKSITSFSVNVAKTKFNLKWKQVLRVQISWTLFRKNISKRPPLNYNCIILDIALA